MIQNSCESALKKIQETWNERGDVSFLPGYSIWRHLHPWKCGRTIEPPTNQFSALRPTKAWQIEFLKECRSARHEKQWTKWSHSASRERRNIQSYVWCKLDRCQGLWTLEVHVKQILMKDCHSTIKTIAQLMTCGSMTRTAIANEHNTCSSWQEDPALHEALLKQFWDGVHMNVSSLQPYLDRLKGAANTDCKSHPITSSSKRFVLTGMSPWP